MNKFGNLELKIQSTYESGVTLMDAERLAAEFLSAQLEVSNLLKDQDLDARMRKSSLKAVRAARYTELKSKSDQKLTESALSALLDSYSMILNLQEELDKAESERDSLERYYDIFIQAHIYYRGISKGKYE